MERIWTFKTARFTVALDLLPEDDLDLSWDDDGSAAAGLESGEFVAFCAKVSVALDGTEIAADYLGNCIYRSGEEFATSHRDPDPMVRNCTIMRAARGGNGVICHYFPAMVAESIGMARAHLSSVPEVRASAA